MSLSTTPRTFPAATAAVLALCWTAVFFDGFDVMVYGAALPYLLDDAHFGLGAATAGTIGSWTTFGMLLGALGCGSLTDGLGRRPVLVGCVLAFSAGSGVCALAPSVPVFAAGRLVTGLGLGGLIPVCIALVTEFAPAGRAALATGVLMSGYHAGGMAATGLGLAVIPDHGWRWAFGAGVLPAVVAAPLLLFLLPESPAVLRLKGRTAQAEAVARRHGVPAAAERAEEAEGAGGRLRAVGRLVAPGRRWSTALLWLGSGCGLMLVYGVSTWLPQLMRSSGYGVTSSVGMLMALNAGGVVGMLIAGTVAERFGPVRVSGIWFLLTAGVLLLLAVHLPVAVTYVVITLAGIWLYSASTMVYAAAGRLYPPSLRAPGLGWVAGVGRVGAVVSPWLGGHLISRHQEHWGFPLFALAGAVGATAVLLAPRLLRAGAAGPRQPAAPPQPAREPGR
ncbi:MFS transporter [Streptomyces sp. Ru71]|uniref:MFS transporter n=1 Tax=Streptomyces sp. Ru71 TaxID=2080746 RepID=UPI000CDD631E|nr:MFS transporter [Streptomyces sp. Ru71]POX48601.1 MFS transporter [Streptomyces sp. Ru71]